MAIDKLDVGEDSSKNSNLRQGGLKIMKNKKAEKFEKNKKHSKEKEKEEKSKKHGKKHNKKHEKKEHVQRPKSKSGKYVSTRNLMEHLFAKNKDLDKDVADKIVKREFPDGAYAKRVKKGGSHFPWYKNHIVHRREFKTIDPPKWAKGKMAKIK